MKNFWKNSLGLLFLTALSVGAAPRIHCAAPVFNFGDLSNHEKVRHVFQLVNQGDEALRLGEIKTACGCTSAEVSKKHLRPGERSDLVVVFDLNRRYGRQDKWINISTNDPQKPMFQMWMKGTAIADIQVTPENILEKVIMPGEVVKRTVRIHAIKDVQFKITAIKPTLSQVKTRLETIEEGRVYDLHVEIPAQDKEKDFYDNIMVITDYKQLPYFSVQVRGKVIRPLQVSPNPVVLTRPPPGASTITRYITVRPGSVTDYEVTGLEWPDPGVKVEIPPANKFGTRIRVSGIVVSEDLLGKEVVIKTTAPKAENIRIPITLK